MVDVTWGVTADLDGNGTYETDLTGYVEKPGNGLSIERGVGRDGKPRVSKLAITFSNRDGAFTPEYPSGTFFGNIRPGQPIRITATHNAIGYTLWTGYLNKTQLRWQTGTVPVAPFDALDLFGFTQGSKLINVTASTTRDTDGAITAIATAMGLVAGDLSLDDGVQDLPMHFAVGANAQDALVAAAASEMGGFLYINALGQIRFESRITRLGTTPAQTWGDGTTIFPNAVEYAFDPDEYITDVTARSTVFRTGQADTLIFEFSQNMFTKPSATSMALTAGQVWERTFQANSAYVALTALAATTDYTANTAQNGTGTDKTSALTATVTDLGGGKFTLKLVNTDAGTIYVTKFQMRGQPVEFYADRAEATFSLSVPNLKAGKGIQLDIPFGGDTGQKLRDYAYQELRVGRYPYPTLRLTFDASTDAKKVALLDVELGDLILYKDTGIGANIATGTASAYVNDWWYVEGIKHDIPPDWGGKNFRSTITLVPSYVYRNLDAIAFDTFDRANVSNDLGTSFSGHTWANDANMDIVSNTARANSDTLQMPVLTVGKADQVVECSFAAIGAGDEVGLVFRHTDANNQYRAYFVQGTNLLKLEKNVASVVTQIGASVAYTVGTTAEMRVFIQSTRIRVYVDRKLYIDTTDSGLATGNNAGLFARNANATATFDNFYSQGLN